MFIRSIRFKSKYGIRNWDIYLFLITTENIIPTLIKIRKRKKHNFDPQLVYIDTWYLHMKLLRYSLLIRK